VDELNPDIQAEMEYELASEHGVPVVRLSGELDIATTDRLDDAVAPVLDPIPPKLIVDVSGVSFADSSAIAKLVQWSLKVDQVEVRGASPLLRRVITTMGLDGKLRLT
jgi:anti-sigma B factor antagonist